METERLTGKKHRHANIYQECSSFLVLVSTIGKQITNILVKGDRKTCKETGEGRKEHNDD